MATGKASGGAKESAADVVAREMPGWRIVPKSVKAASPLAALSGAKGDGGKVDDGLSIAKLREKFHISGSKIPAASEFDAVDMSVETVRIEPKSGGPAKTADIKNGKIKIVQG